MVDATPGQLSGISHLTTSVYLCVGKERERYNSLAFVDHKDDKVTVWHTPYSNSWVKHDTTMTENITLCCQKQLSWAQSTQSTYVQSSYSTEQHITSLLHHHYQHPSTPPQYNHTMMCQRRLVTLLYYYRTHIADDVSMYSFART